MREGTIPPNQLKKIAAFITPSRIQKLISSLIRIPSPSGEEASILRFVEMYLGQYALNVKRQYVNQGRYNLLVHGGDKTRPSVLLNTHVDTVPNDGAANCVPRRGGNFIHGRGSCDAKGSLAAMLMAFVAMRQSCEGGQIPVDLCLTVGEEKSGDGSGRFVQDCPRHAWAIVGEPTDLRIVNCHAGFVELTLSATSIRSHAFEPAGGQPISAVADLILEIQRAAQRRGEKPVHTFIDWIEGGDRSPFWSIGSSCKASLVMNTYSKREIASVIRLARSSCAAVARRHKGVRIDVLVEDYSEGLLTPRNAPVVGFLSNSLCAIGRPCKIGALPSWTDGARLCAAGIPTVVFGPGSLKDAHTCKEKVKIKDVRDASIAIAGAILAWRGQSPA